MKFNKLVITLIVVLGLAVLTGCGGSRSASLTAGLPDGRSGDTGLAGPIPLASPRDLARDLAFTGEDRLLTGSQFLPGPEYGNAGVDGSTGVFDPDYSVPDKTSLTDTAFAVYVFDIELFEGDPQVEFHWATPPADPANLYIGLGHHLGNTWDWYPGPDGGPLQLDPLTAYLSGEGLIIVAVVLLGDQPAVLDWIRAGGSTGPVAGISADPAAGTVPQLVTFDASASLDYGGTVVSYAWDLDGNPDFEVGPNPEATLENTFFTAGTYDVGVLVTDDVGQTDTAYTTVVMNVPGNQAPVAVLLADPETGNAPLDVDFDASTSDDADGTIDLYEWDWEGDGTWDLSGPTATVSHTYVADGTYNATVRVSDNHGVSDTDSVSISVNTGSNQPPVAGMEAAPRHGIAPLAVTFDSTTSSDPDGSISKYEYDWESSGSFVEDSANAQHTYTVPGTYDCILRVTDNSGASDTTTYRVTASGGSSYDEQEENDDTTQSNAVPGFNFTNFSGSLGEAGYNGDDNDWYQLRLTEDRRYTIYMHDFLHADADLDIKLFREDGTTQVGSSISTGNDEEIVWLCDATAIYYLRCYVHISGNSADCLLDISEVIVVPPVADLSANPTSGDWPLTVDFDASGSLDPDGSIDSYDWDWDGDGGYEVTGEVVPTYQYEYTTAGVFNATVRVTDNDGAQDTAFVEISVNNEPPVADVTADPTSGDWPLTVDFDASGSSDPDGVIDTWDWDWDGDGSYEVTGEVVPTYQHEYTVAGEFNATVRVTDNAGNTDTDFIVITVINEAPVADFTAVPTSGSRPLEVEFDASASYDPDAGGGIAKYEWDFDDSGTWDLTKTPTSDDPTLATARYWRLGSFDATLRVTDVAGATDEHTVQITVTGNADNESEANNDEDTANTAADAALADAFPAFPFFEWFGQVGPEPVVDGPFNDPDDWYRFTVGQSGEVYLYMELFDMVCDIDMALYAEGIYTSTLASSTNTDDDEEITYSLDAGTYYLRVYVYTGTPDGNLGGYRMTGTFTP